MNTSSFQNLSSYIFQKELNLTLSGGGLQMDYFGVNFNENGMFSYFFSLKSQIKNDSHLTQAVFGKILGLPKNSIEIKKEKPFLIKGEKISINEWRVNLNMIIGGEVEVINDCFQIKIKLSEGVGFEDYLESGAKRKLLEEILIPNFLSEKADFKIKIEVTELARKFILDEKIKGGRINISTII